MDSVDTEGAFWNSIGKDMLTSKANILGGVLEAAAEEMKNSMLSYESNIIDEDYVNKSFNWCYTLRSDEDGRIRLSNIEEW